MSDYSAADRQRRHKELQAEAGRVRLTTFISTENRAKLDRIAAELNCALSVVLDRAIEQFTVSDVVTPPSLADKLIARMDALEARMDAMMVVTARMDALTARMDALTAGAGTATGADVPLDVRLEAVRLHAAGATKADVLAYITQATGLAFKASFASNYTNHMKNWSSAKRDGELPDV